MSISNALKEKRKELGYTLLDIANKVGVSEATVQRWESGNIKNLRQNRISQLAEVLQVSPSYLMGWEEGVQGEAKEPTGEYTVDTKFTELELKCINKFRSLDEYGRKAVEAILTVEYERCKETAYDPWRDCPDADELDKLCVEPPDRAIND